MSFIISKWFERFFFYSKRFFQKTVENIAGLPHTTVQKFMAITVAVVVQADASRHRLQNIRTK
jgi:hypothetical protein